MTDPKTPEERLSEAKGEALHCALFLCGHDDEGCEKVIDHLATLAVLVGRIQQQTETLRVLHETGDPLSPTVQRLRNGARVERDRLLAELEQHGL